MLSLNNIEVAYDSVFLAVKSISIDVPAGGLVALLGANGAGKSTTLKAISGLLRPERGEVTKGEITFAGKNLLALDPPDRVRLGLAHVLEGRRVGRKLLVLAERPVGRAGAPECPPPGRAAGGRGCVAGHRHSFR